MSVVELAIDIHAIRVIATNNYQQCITAIWRGYYTIQYDDEGRLAFGPYQHLLSRRFIDHFDPQRMKGTLSLSFNSSSVLSKSPQFMVYIAFHSFLFKYCQ